MSGTYKNIGFIEAFLNLLKNFGSYTFMFLILFFFVINVQQYAQFKEQADMIYLTFLMMTAMFVVFTLIIRNRPQARKHLDKFWNENKLMHGGTFIASLFGSSILFIFIFSFFQGNLNTNVVAGLLADRFILTLNMYIVSFLETLIFAISLPILMQHFSKSEFFGNVFASVIFAYYHYFQYDGNAMLLFFAFIMNMIFIYLVFMFNYRRLSTLAITISGHAIFNLASIGALLYILPF